MKIIDPLAVFIEKSGIIPSIVGSYFNNWLPHAGENVNCPWHADTRASLHISLQGQAYCHGCRDCASNIIELVSKMEDITYNEAGQMLYKQIVDPVPEGRLLAYEKNLLRNEEAMEYLTITRNLNTPTIKKYRLGLDPKDDRIIIPVFDQFNGCVNVRRMGWLKKHEKKALNKKGQGNARLYPEADMVRERRLLLVEGEYDCLVGRSFGLPAVTWTCGATSWNEEHQYLFQDKAVFILYDNDKAGMDATKEIVSKLQGLAYHVEVLSPINDKQGKDLSNWSFTDMDKILVMKDYIARYKFPRNARAIELCPYCKRPMEAHQ